MANQCERATAARLAIHQIRTGRTKGMIHRHFFVGLIAVCASANLAAAQDIETDASGRQWRVSRITSKRPVSETHLEERPYTVYTEKLHTEYHPTARTVLTPVTEYHWEPYLANRWNPFAAPTVQYRYVPKTRWESRIEQSHIPVSRRELVPEQRVAHVPVVRQRFEDVVHETRVAVNPSSSDPFTATASRPTIGGTSLSENVPRQGQIWQPSAPTSTVMRR